MKIIVNNKEIEVKNEITLEEIAKMTHENAVYGVVDSRSRELSYSIKKPCTIDFGGIDSVLGEVIYRSTLTFIFNMAMYEINPKFIPTIRSSVCRSMYVKMDSSLIDILITKMNEIINKKLQIKRISVSKEEAIKIYDKFNYKAKKELLKYRKEDNVNLYICNDYINYMYSYMLPNTSYITKFNIFKYQDGICIQYPTLGSNENIRPFKDEPVYFKTLSKSYNKSVDNNVKYIYQLNELINKGNVKEILDKADLELKESINDLVNDIKKVIHDKKIIAIAGPSSSGKTTFCKMLQLQLNKRGIETLSISIDNFYKGLNKAPINEFGEYDYEHIEALNIELFDKTMFDLVNDKETSIPEYDFKTGIHTFGEKIKLKENQVILIEGIHALNDLLTKHIDNRQKYKIFISPLQQIFIDEQNQIRTSDIRLIRRMIRDNDTRNCNALGTLDMWQSVRRGEFKWIYPHQEFADYVFSSQLLYELPVTKNKAIKLLNEIPENSEHYITANRLKKFLKYFNEINEEEVSCDSLLREFIGGSSFYDY